jgi:uncharacterized protein
MEFPSSGGRKLIIDEYETTKLLAHASRQAKQRNFDRMTIVDVDMHCDEGSAFREIVSFIKDPVQRQWAMSATAGDRRPMVPREVAYDDAGGRIPRIAAGTLEKTEENVHRIVSLADRSMQAMGVDYSCVLPTTVLRLGAQPKKDMDIAIGSAYNEWLAEILLPQAPNLRGMLYLPLYDAEACYKTVSALARKPGIVGCVASSPRYAMIHQNAFMKTYAVMEERGLTLAFHSGANWGDRTMGLLNRYLSVQAIGGPHFNAVHMTNWLVNGMPERFPKLNVLWMESGLAWVPFMMQRLDNSYMMRVFDAPLLKRKPSEYMREMYYCSQPMERPDDIGLLEATFRAINAETQLVWGSNYPNADFDLPSIIYDLPFLSGRAKQNILGRTAAQLLRLQ